MNTVSPKTFLKTHVFDKNIERPPKRTKVTSEEFVIPCYNEWNLLTVKNYNVSQLKMIARHYKMKISGNKGELLSRVYNNLKYSNYAIILQKLWRGTLRRNYNRLKGGTIHRKCTNTTDFLSLSDIKNIPYSQFFSFKDNGQHFGFSAKSLHNLILKNNRPVNPYTRSKIPKKTLESFNKFLKYGKLLHEKTNIIIDNETESLSLAKRISLKAQNLFHKIDTFGHITDASWFLSLDKPMSVKLVRELIDIWEYRANLPNETKRAICPPHGNPFAGINTNHLITQNMSLLKMNILNMFENLLSKSPSRENQGLGAYYILCAITLVSPSAASALPWLFEAVMYNQ